MKKQLMTNKQLAEGDAHQISSPIPPTWDLTGKILAKEIKKVYDKASPFLGNAYFKLKIISEDDQKKSHIFVYSNLVTPQLFQDI